MGGLAYCRLGIVIFITCLGACMFSVSEEENLPIILWWTELIYPHVEEVTVISCPTSKCIASNQKSHFKNETDNLVLLFYGTDLDIENLPLPRKNDHVWALLHEESPMNNFIFSHSLGIKLFNFTSTFSRHSDFPVTTQFLPSLKYLTDRKPLSIHVKNKLRKSGLAPVMYLQSHCHVASDRDRYVAELMKYVDIDSYGACLHNKDLPSSLNDTLTYEDTALLELISQYKFHIAFENAICDDYITEKLFRPLHVGSVPIYKGSPSVKEWEPSPNSIIIVDNFPSPEALANHIKNLDQNDDLYNDYLSFKSGITNEFLKGILLQRSWNVNDGTENDFIRGFECYICTEMNKVKNWDNKVAFSKIGSKSHMNCHQPHVSFGSDIDISKKDEWMKEDWIESYWFAYDQAKAIHKLIQNKEKSSAHIFDYMTKLKYEH